MPSTSPAADASTLMTMSKPRHSRWRFRQVRDETARISFTRDGGRDVCRRGRLSMAPAAQDDAPSTWENLRTDEEKSLSDEIDIVVGAEFIVRQRTTPGTG